MKIQPALARSVRLVVNIQKIITKTVFSGSAELSSTYASIAVFWSGIWFGNVLLGHTNDTDDFYFSDQYYKVFCIGKILPDAVGEEIFLNLANTWGILNIGCALESGWPVSMSKHKKLYDCILIENKDLYVQCWDSVNRTF